MQCFILISAQPSYGEGCCNDIHWPKCLRITVALWVLQMQCAGWLQIERVSSSVCQCLESWNDCEENSAVTPNPAAKCDHIWQNHTITVGLCELMFAPLISVFSGLQVQHKLHGWPAVPPSLRRLQCVSERHHAEWKESAQLRSFSAQVTS